MARGPRSCRNCGQQGHYAPTCPNPAPCVPVSQVSVRLSLVKDGSVNLHLIDGNGGVAVDPVKYPSLHAALTRGKALVDSYKDKWAQIWDLRQKNQHDAADRMTRKLLGISEPMSEEKKAELKRYNEEHKEEIATRQKQKREGRKLLQEAIARQSDKLRRRKTP